MSSIVVVTGSPSRVSRTSALARHIGAELSADGSHVHYIDVRALPADALLAADVADTAISAAVQAVLGADAVVVATPIFKASYSGLLKSFLDLLPQSALLDKVVLPIATGGTVAHVLAIDYSLRPVLMSLGAGHITPGRFVLDKHIEITTDGADFTDESTRACVVRTTNAFRNALTEHDHQRDSAAVLQTAAS